MLTCANCGAENREGARFCDSCGRSVALAEAAEPYGLHEVTPELTKVKKTSPCGGSQHPVEVYPLVRAVKGVEPGLYQYAVDAHALELDRPLGLSAFTEAAILVCGCGHPIPSGREPQFRPFVQRTGSRTGH